jgi:hypothetical protein
MRLTREGLTRLLSICALCAIPSTLLLHSALGHAGEILILRDVPTRVATREGPGQVAPVTVEIAPDMYVQGSVGPMTPLGDADFAAVAGGVGSTLQIDSSLRGLPNGQDMRGLAGALGNAPRHGGGAMQNVGGQINRSIQQGLKPLHNLGAR